MVSQINNIAGSSGLVNKVSVNKENIQKQGVSVSSQGDTSKVQQIKDAIESGEYKVNLQALSERIAEELM
jgi:anti-sigma28 factor (negative regulator of flagellin synthesis)